MPSPFSALRGRLGLTKENTKVAADPEVCVHHEARTDAVVDVDFGSGRNSDTPPDGDSRSRPDPQPLCQSPPPALRPASPPQDPLELPNSSAPERMPPGTGGDIEISAGYRRRQPLPAVSPTPLRQPLPIYPTRPVFELHTRHNVERSLDDLVRELLHPLLKEWLNQHLPRIVEQLVDEEIARTRPPHKGQPS